MTKGRQDTGRLLEQIRNGFSEPDYDRELAGHILSGLSVTGKRITVRPLALSDYEVFVRGYKDCLPSRNR